MPATEETYRSQRALHVVFAISSIGLLLATVWMIMADHLRPWKTVQREFQDVETAKLARSEQEKLKEQQDKSQRELDQIDREIAQARENARKNYRQIRAKLAQIDGTKGEFEKLD